MQSTELALTGRDAMIALGLAANEFADRDMFRRFNARKSANTLRAYRDDLGSFAKFMDEATHGAVQVDAIALQESPDAWHGVTYGLVANFQRWLEEKQGASTGTINRRLAAIKVYARMAADAGALNATEAARIANRITGYGKKEAINVDKKRTDAGIATRQGAKKAQHVPLSADQIKALKTQPDTPQGRRDALLMCLLLDHGLRVGELAILTVVRFDGETVQFFRPKVGKAQTHRLSPDTRRALTAYLANDAPMDGGLLFRRTAKNGKALTDAEIRRRNEGIAAGLTTRNRNKAEKNGKDAATVKTVTADEIRAAGMTERNLSGRVRTLGKRIGIPNLSAHDCRHSWATRAVAGGTDAFALRDAGGWSSLAMPSHYVEAAAIANEKVTLK